MVKVEVNIELENGERIQKIIEQQEDGKEKTEIKDASEGSGKMKIKNISPEDKKKYDVASDLANVCEYMQDVDVMKVRLIVDECEKRKAGR